jgi:large subunit ribosomal protein L3
MANKQAILGRKVGMTQVFIEGGEAVGVTVIEAGPCYVTQIKTVATDGYNAIQIGFGQTKKLNKPEAGHLRNTPALRNLREIRTDDVDQYKLGQVIDAAVFAVGDAVDVTGISKGKGFAGGMKRHHFRGGPKTRGGSDRDRAVGAISSGTTPGRVWKGLRGPGHLGNEQVTTLNLKVIVVDASRNLLAIEGAVPGAINGIVMVRKSIKTRAARRKRPLQE